jgi:hypothetical protein
MKIEDELRSTLGERAERVRSDDETAWSRFALRGKPSDTAKRIAAAVVAVAVAVGAMVLVIEGFAPNHETEPRTSPSPVYTSVDQIVGLLRAGGAGCARRGTILSISQGVKDTGTCLVEGNPIDIYLYATPAAMRRHAHVPATPHAWAGVFWVRGANWFIATGREDTAATVRALLGGEILGGTGRAPSVVTPTPTPSDVPSCTGDQLDGHEVVTGGGAAGNVWAPIVLVNRSSRACALSGYPRVRFLDAAGQDLGLIATDSPVYDGTAPPSPVSRAPFVLGPGSRAWFIVHFSDIVPPCSLVTSLRIVPPGAAGTLLVPISPVHEWDVCAGGISITAAMPSRPRT